MDRGENFSCDLVHAAICHKVFLQAVHNAGISLRAPTSKEFLRYERVWLPLLKILNDQGRLAELNLRPPLDVAWLWHCHRLAPLAYERACKEALATTCALDCPLAAFSAQQQNSPHESNNADNKATRALWELHFPSEPFFAPSSDDFSLGVLNEQWVPDKHVSHGGPRTYGVIANFDVVESAERQASFLWQISGHRFNDLDFLREGVENYACFLRLMKLHPRAFLVPTYQIDLMWHSHMLASTSAYKADCATLTGSTQTVDHDDSVNDRSSPETKLNTSTLVTKELWFQAFGRPFEVPGGMYRGPPPSSFWHPSWKTTSAVAENSKATPMGWLRAMVLWDALDAPVDPPLAVRVIGGAPPIVVVDAEVVDDTVYGIKYEAVKHLSAFIPQQAKSTTRGVNSNPRKDNYIFGEGPSGVGYYRLDTDGADTIIVKRLTLKLSALSSRYGIKRTQENSVLNLVQTEIMVVDKKIASLEADIAANNGLCACLTKCSQVSELNMLKQEKVRLENQSNEISVVETMINNPQFRKSTKPGEATSKRQQDDQDSTSPSAAGAGCGGIVMAGLVASCGGSGYTSSEGWSSSDAAAGCGTASCGGGGGDGGGGGGCGGGGCGGGGGGGD